MTFGITDYPSLGFREDMVGPNATSTRSWAEPFGCLSRLIKQLGGGKEGSDMKREGEKIGELKIKKEGDSSAQEDETGIYMSMKTCVVLCWSKNAILKQDNLFMCVCVC